MGWAVAGSVLPRVLGHQVADLPDALLPTVPVVQSGTFYRWRMLWTGFKRFVTLAIVDPATGQPATECELQLLAKDGVYLGQIPRTVAGVFLPPGGR